jgi:hypothetical protein
LGDICGDIDIVDITVGTMKNGVIDGAIMRELWLLIVIVEGGEVADDWKLVDVGVILGTESSFSVFIYIEVVLLVGKILEMVESFEMGVEEPPIGSRSKAEEELDWKMGSFFVILFAVKGVSIPGLKDREIA